VVGAVMGSSDGQSVLAAMFLCSAFFYAILCFGAFCGWVLFSAVMICPALGFSVGGGRIL